MLLGIIVGGLVKTLLNPAAVARHLGQGRFWPVVKAAVVGIPLPLCSCGVLPAAAALKRQGANNGATTSFLIATPESGVDSIAITYALLDPVMTVARPLAAFVTATVAGLAENLAGGHQGDQDAAPDLSCPVDACCDGIDCPPEEHARHHTLGQKLVAGQRYAFGELWADLAGWFFLGLLLAGVITALVPERLISTYLGGGLVSMLAMLAVGIPLYICSTASTPIAAALILKGVSPGAALVFLLAGPATNLTSLTVVGGILGRRATAIYLVCIAVVAVVCGLALDAVYAALGISAAAVVGRASEVVPEWAKLAGAIALILLSLPVAWRWLRARLGHRGHQHHDHAVPPQAAPGPSCSTGST
jgi:hypothetical protein